MKKALSIFAVSTLAMTGAYAQSGATSTASCADHLNTSSDPNVGALLSCLVEMQRSINRLQEQVSETARSVPTAEELKAALLNDPEANERLTSDVAGIPEDAVVAFVDECPSDGWVPYFPAAGRMLIGAGLHGETGGLRNEDQHGNPLLVYDGPNGVTDETLQTFAGANAGKKLRVGGAETHTLTAKEAPKNPGKISTDLSLTLFTTINSGNSARSNTLSTYHSTMASKSELKFATGDAIPAGANTVRFTSFGFEAFEFPDISTLSNEEGGNPHNNMPPYIALYFCKKKS